MPMVIDSATENICNLSEFKMKKLEKLILESGFSIKMKKNQFLLIQKSPFMDNYISSKPDPSGSITLQGGIVDEDFTGNIKFLFYNPTFNELTFQKLSPLTTFKLYLKTNNLQIEFDEEGAAKNEENEEYTPDFPSDNEELFCDEVIV